MGTAEPVLVTGGLGTVGSYVCRRLAERGQRPVIIDPSPDSSLIRDIRDSCELVDIDVTQAEAVAEVLAKYRPVGVAHVASLVGPRVEANPGAAVSVNLGGLVAVLDAMRAVGLTRIAYVSSKMVYGPVEAAYQYPEYRELPEQARLRPATFYGKLKRAAEDILGQYAQCYGLAVVVLRCASIFGPGRLGGDANRGTGAIGRLVGAALRGVDGQVDPDERRSQYCYTGDYAGAIVAALDRAGPEGSCLTCNIASDIFCNETEIAEAIQRVVRPGWRWQAGSAGADKEADKKEARKHGFGREFDFRMDTSRAAELLAFHPQFDLESAIADCFRLVGG